MNFREFHAEEAWVLEEGFFVIGRESSQSFLNEEKLVQLVLSWEHGVSIDEFAHDAANSPDIDLLRIGSADQQFWRAVPSRGHVVSHLLLSSRLLELASEPEIADLELLAVADQQILGLDVAVHEVQRVHVGEALQKLVHVEPDELGIEAVLGLLQHFEQVVLHVLEDEVDDALLAEGLLELDDVGVLEHLEHLHLAHGGLLDYFVLLGLLELLDGHHFAGLVAAALEHHAVRALPDDPHYIVLLHY